MTDLISGATPLVDFVGLTACGSASLSIRVLKQRLIVSRGFSYGDVLGAGRGWASTVLYNPKVREQFKAFFERKNTFTLGVCNGCQFLSQLQSIIPGTEGWPTFETNLSEQYEARVSMVKITDSSTAPSVFLHGMHNSALPIAVAHGEGRAKFKASSSAQQLIASGRAAIRYVDNTALEPTERYPANPNGSPLGIAGVSSSNGR